MLANKCNQLEHLLSSKRNRQQSKDTCYVSVACAIVYRLEMRFEIIQYNHNKRVNNYVLKYMQIFIGKLLEQYIQTHTHTNHTPKKQNPEQFLMHVCMFVADVRHTISSITRN